MKQSDKDKQQKHEIALDEKGHRQITDDGWWICECGATTFPNCGWFGPSQQEKCTCVCHNYDETVNNDNCCDNPRSKSQPVREDTWIKEFNKLMIGFSCDAKPSVKAFISNLLQSQKAELIKKIARMKKEHKTFCSRDHYYHEPLDDLLSELKESK